MTRTLEETVATLARDVPKPSDKAQAFNAIRRIISDIEWEGMDCAADLARLYAHFLPRQSKRATTPFAWCAQAIAGKNDVREYLTYVYVTEDDMVGTDGASLHIAPNADGLEPGFYSAQAIRLHPPTYARYPDYNRAIPHPGGRGRCWYHRTLDELPMAARATETGKTYSYYKLPTGQGTWPEAPESDRQYVHVDAKLLNRLVSMDPGEAFEINTGGMGDSVYAELSGGRRAVIMPLRQ